MQMNTPNFPPYLMDSRRSNSLNGRIGQCELMKILLQYLGRGGSIEFVVRDCPATHINLPLMCSTSGMDVAYKIGRYQAPYRFLLVRPGPSRWHFTMIGPDNGPFFQRDFTSLEELVDCVLIQLTSPGTDHSIMLQNGTVFSTRGVFRDTPNLKACVVGCARSYPVGNCAARQCCSYAPTCCHKSQSFPRTVISNEAPCPWAYRQASFNKITQVGEVSERAASIIPSPPVYALTAPQRHIEFNLRNGGFAMIYLSDGIISPFHNEESDTIKLTLFNQFDGGLIQCTCMKTRTTIPLSFAHLHQWIAFWSLDEMNARVETSDGKRFYLRKTDGAQDISPTMNIVMPFCASGACGERGNCCYSEPFFMTPYNQLMQC